MTTVRISERLHAASFRAKDEDTRGLTGWAALEDHVRKSEERTVQDYKEDMDALLVFVRMETNTL